MSKRNREKKLAKQQARQVEKESRRTALPVVQMGMTHFNWQNRGGKLPDRECGGCTACCTALGIEKLGKPANCQCEHQEKHSCGVYPDRPDECKIYLCCWRLGWGDENDRPDKSGILLSLAGGKDGNPSLDLIELQPEAGIKRFNKVVEGRTVFDSTELVNSLPESGAWTLDIIPYDTPRSESGWVADRYKFHHVVGNDYMTKHGPIRVLVGVINGDTIHASGNKTTTKERYDTWVSQVANSLRAPDQIKIEMK